MYKLRDYQEKAISEVQEKYKQGFNAPCLVLSTGSGKTVCAGAIIKSAYDKGKRVVFIVHRRELAGQTCKTLKGFGIEPAYIMANTKPDPENKVQIALVGTLCNRLDKYKKPDLIIFDEAHHCLAGQWQKIMTAWAGASVLGLTATPCRLDGKPLATAFDSIVCGPSTKELIERGALTPYDYYAPPTIDLSGLPHNRTDYTKDALALFSREKKIIGDNVAQYKAIANGKRNIVFACNVLHSKEIVQRYLEAGIPAAHLDGDTPTEERERILKDFSEGKIKVLSNVELFGEGFDLPSIECVSLLRPTLSTSLYLQQVGRALRPCPELNKERAIIFDHADNYIRHGMPDEERIWSLKAGLVHKNRSQKSEPIVRVQRCPECFFAHSPAIKCPKCGHIYRNENGVKEVAGELVLLGTKEHEVALQREIKEVESYEELVRIETERNHKMWWAEITWKHKTGEDLTRSMSGLMRIAKVRGYSKGWAWIQARNRKLI